MISSHIAFAQSQDGTVISSGVTRQILSLSTPYLVVLFPTEMHQRFALSEKHLILGRSKEADITIPDELISREHCEIWCQNGQIWIKDLASTNGTFVDGGQITLMELGPDNRLQLGKVILRVDFKDQSEIEQEKALFEAATTDALTRIPNRRFFLERSRSELSAAKRTNRWIHAILLDVDHFKKVNDTWGHPAGDFVLREGAALLDKLRREEDLLARWGGEEFVFLLTGIDPKQALAFAERVRKTFESHRFVWDDVRIPITISLGLAGVQGAGATDLDNLISVSDTLLYQAKRAGRNQVCAQAG
jgi:diguanylate cyclase (GGDEF)-like protein